MDSADIAQRKFKFISAFTGRNRRMYCLCAQCCNYLNDENDESTYYANGWCSFIWYILCNEDIHSQYGESIWKFIPSTWRSWWISSARRDFPHVYENITLEYPSAAFKDISTDINDWDDAIQSYNLARLAQAANDHLQPTIKCPWGYSGFIHTPGYLSIDVMYQRILQKVSLDKLLSTTRDVPRLYNNVCAYIAVI